MADFGVSSLHLDKKERGFSFKSETLDMRMDQNAKVDAKYILNNYSQDQLEKIFREYGEIKEAKKLAKEIIVQRAKEPITTPSQLIEIANRVIKKRSNKNIATTLFQAIRIEVNSELKEIEELLDFLEELKPKGAIVSIITFHSLEDRLIKNRFKKWAQDCICPPQAIKCSCGNNHSLGKILSKVITPSKEEIKNNPRSRSAKLRVFRFKE